MEASDFTMVGKVSSSFEVYGVPMDLWMGVHESAGRESSEVDDLASLFDLDVDDAPDGPAAVLMDAAGQWDSAVSRMRQTGHDLTVDEVLSDSRQFVDAASAFAQSLSSPSDPAFSARAMMLVLTCRVLADQRNAQAILGHHGEAPRQSRSHGHGGSAPSF